MGEGKVGGSRAGALWTEDKKQLLKRKLEHYRQYMKTEEDQEPPRFLELFAGSGRLTETVKKHAAVYIPQDIFDRKGKFVGGEMDLTVSENQVRIRTLVRKQKVRWLHCAPPCKTFSRARRTDQWGSAEIFRSEEYPMGFGLNEHEPRVAEANALAKFTAKLCRAQMRAGPMDFKGRF